MYLHLIMNSFHLLISETLGLREWGDKKGLRAYCTLLTINLSIAASMWWIISGHAHLQNVMIHIFSHIAGHVLSRLMSMQHVQYIALFLVLAVNSDRFQILQSYMLFL